MLFHVVVLQDRERIHEAYLNPTNDHVRFKDVPLDTSVQFAVPIEREIGYAWSESYLPDRQAENNGPEQRTLEIDAMIYRTIVNGEYFFDHERTSKDDD